MIRSMESFDIIQSKIRYSLASDEYIHMEDNDSIVKLHKVKKTNGTHESFLLCTQKHPAGPNSLFPSGTVTSHFGFSRFIGTISMTCVEVFLPLFHHASLIVALVFSR